ncbi:MAG: hypothetical protein ICV64_02105 [Thermoleophilia bacterium]|nr:hypothetical protein [Thermoleophilia bacterium]
MAARRPRVQWLPSERAARLRAATFVLAFLALALFLWPTTRTWYLGDDAQHAFTPDAVVQRGDSLAGLIFHEIERSAQQTGRFAPLAYFVVVPAYWLTPSVFAFKVGALLIALLAVALATILLRQLGLAWPYAALLPLSLCAVVQFRYWHDPLLGYAAGIPIVASLVLGSLVAFLAGIRRNSVVLHVAAVALFAAACLYWEGTPLLMPVVVPVAWAFGNPSLRVVVRRAAPFAAVSASFVVLVLALRAAAPAITEYGHSALYKPDVSAATVVPALAKQISGSVPLSYLIVAVNRDAEADVRPEHRASPYGAAAAGEDVAPGLVDSLRALLADEVSDPLAIALLLLVVAVLALALTAAVANAAPRRAAVTTLGVGVCLVIGAALAPVLSYRWQREIFFGVPYISVFIEYLGVAMVIVAALALVLGALRSRPAAAAAGAVVFAACVTAVSAATYALNARVVEAFRGVETAMEFNEQALAGGLLRTPRRANELLIDDSDAPLSAHFISVASGDPVPPTSSLAEFDRTFATCADDREACERVRNFTPWLGIAPVDELTSPVAYLTRLDQRGMPWAAVCAIDVAATRRAAASACQGEITVAVGGERFPRTRCSSLILDGVAVQTGRARPARLPIRLVETRSARSVRFCRAEARAPVYARSIVVSPRRSPAEGPLRIVTTYPSETRAGEPFNVQPDGRSALAVEGVGITPSTRVVVGGVDLLSQYADEHLVTALVPKRLFARPRRLPVVLRDRGVRSNTFILEVTR